MSLVSHYLQTAQQLLKQYQGQTPFAPVLRQFFASHKKYGSRDRKVITQLCYAWFRCGRAFHQKPFDEQLLLSLFFCSHQPQNIFQHLKPGWNEWISLSHNEKEIKLGEKISPEVLFSWQKQLSAGVEGEAFAFSLLNQPRLFLRIRPGYKTAVIAKLDQAGEPYQQPAPTAISLPNATKAEAYLNINQDVVVQDFSSQHTGTLLAAWLNQQPDTGPIHKVWDCCAASGGKSIMLSDLLPGIKLTVSDIRNSILNNLKTRFAEAGIKGYTAFLGDAGKPGLNPPGAPFDLIVADVPCTGSGTWARTPEQLCFFNEKTITQFAETQYQIASNVLSYLRPGGWLVFITCSVFEAENEGVVNRLLRRPDLILKHSQIINGLPYDADSMFIALMQVGG